jgi:hypothetical protein
MAANKQPENQLRCGNIKATICKTISEKGPFFSPAYSRPCKGSVRGMAERDFFQSE